MSRLEPKEAELDEAFERALIGAARGETPSREATDAAWDRFALALSGAAAVGGAVAAGAAGAKSAAAKAATKWAFIGAVGGSSVTAALFGFAPLHSAAPPAAAMASSTTTHVVASVPSGVAPAHPPATESPPTAPTPRADVVAPKPVLALRHRRRARTTQESNLAAEVSLLDAARTASSTGANDDALRLIDEYRSRFPAGELAVDAEVVAIDALVEKRDLESAAALGGRFLAQHPNDPHAAHVREVIDRE
jgi:hypothetical protein